MNKQELRQACRENGIKNYGKMTVAQMRTELIAKLESEQTQNKLRTIIEGLQVHVAQTAKVAQTQKPRKSTVKKIEQNRPTQNGVTRPSIGGKCRRVWDILDELETPSLANIKKIAKQRRWNLNNTIIEYYQWKKFNRAAV